MSRLKSNSGSAWEAIIILMLIVGMIYLADTSFGAECVIKDNRPNPKCTPGAIMAESTTKNVCTPLYTAKVRNVMTAVKRQVFAEYGMDNKKAPCPCEVDHFVSLELGGSNDIKNLWPEPYQEPMGARTKDKVEDYLHAQLCKGNITLEVAQEAIKSNWKDVYGSIHQKN